MRGTDIDPAGHCLFSAAASLLILWARGHRNYILQAGSAFWRAEEQTPEGLDPLMFGYQYDKDIALAYLAKGMMPEMHCWVGDPTTNTVLDITSRDQVIQAKRTASIDWDDAVVPPDYEWRTCADSQGKYRPDEHAIMAAAYLLKEAGIYKAVPVYRRMAEHL